jgi:hypothetical protein
MPLCKHKANDILGPTPSLNLNLVLLHSLQAFIQKDRQTGIPTDRRTEGQTDKQTEETEGQIQTDMTNGQMDGRTDGRTDIQKRLIYRPMIRWVNGQTDKVGRL